MVWWGEVGGALAGYEWARYIGEESIEDQRRLVGFDGSIEVSYEWVEGKLVDTWRRGVSFGSCF